ncbi:MAG: helix-turn-helix transcriptional regulator [Candidatus Hydrogenedentes bacterium]|nr:helix-turn-helix transcriptional regulator [Candidatus Hydrogenedentota bacterium]
MLDYTDEKKYWREARRARGLSVNRLAQQLSKRMGYTITLDQLANWEYRMERRPKVDVWRAIEWQIREWRREDSMANETNDVYARDFVCPGCGALVPGPTVNAEYCMFCGIRFGGRCCAMCGRIEAQESAKFCMKCGSQFPEE